MKRELSVLRMVVVLSLLALPVGAQSPAAAPSPNAQADVEEFTSIVRDALSAFGAVSAMVPGSSQAQSDPAASEITKAQPAEAAQAAPNPQESAPTPSVSRRPVKNSIVLIASGAGLGAAIGRMSGKKNGPLVGAIAGGVAGLIYDRATYKNPKGI